MSTFNGIVHEFPSITIDWFRPHPGRRPPLACFLSHVHGDHLTGLESLRSPFVYCSAATRAMLLCLEKRSSRVAYAAGMREVPVRTYRHLRALLKPIPLDTPTNLELEPGNHLQVTLLDANHCPGAVMFLIEGQGRAILYTGDIRSEPWWVNSIARSPCLVEYSSGIRTLDRIYLDTSMLSSYPLQSKAEGLRELLEKVLGYPEDTVFCMQAWTYGYEEVWVALSRALRSKIHVDRYKMGVYRSLVARPDPDGVAGNLHHTREAPYLVGFSCGNVQHEGCLTLDENVRIHSCEKGTACSVVQTRPVVWIQPIVAHLADGHDVSEVGLGGGGDDLEQETDIRHLGQEDLELLIKRIDGLEDLSAELRRHLKNLLLTLVTSEPDSPDDTAAYNLPEETHIRLESVIWPLVKSTIMAKEVGPSEGRSLPNRIRFPYARHSSYPELRHLVETFRPMDVWPCTVDLPRWRERGITMRERFGAYCRGNSFEHDQLLVRLSTPELHTRGEAANESQETAATSPGESSSPVHPPNRWPHGTDVEGRPTLAPEARQAMPMTTEATRIKLTTEHEQCDAPVRMLPTKRLHSFVEREEQVDDDNDMNRRRGRMTTDLQVDSQASTLSDRAYETRLDAFRTTILNCEGADWRSIGLISTTDNHSTLDEELGSS